MLRLMKSDWIDLILLIKNLLPETLMGSSPTWPGHMWLTIGGTQSCICVSIRDALMSGEGSSEMTRIMHMIICKINLCSESRWSGNFNHLLMLCEFPIRHIVRKYLSMFQ